MMVPRRPGLQTAMNPVDSETAGERHDEVDSSDWREHLMRFCNDVGIPAAEGDDLTEEEKEFNALAQWLRNMRLGDVDPEAKVARYFFLRKKWFGY